MNKNIESIQNVLQHFISNLLWQNPIKKSYKKLILFQERNLHNFEQIWIETCSKSNNTSFLKKTDFMFQSIAYNLWIVKKFKLLQRFNSTWKSPNSFKTIVSSSCQTLSKQQLHELQRKMKKVMIIFIPSNKNWTRKPP